MKVLALCTVVFLSLGAALTGVGAQAAASQEFFPACFKAPKPAVPLVMGTIEGFALRRPKPPPPCIASNCDCTCNGVTGACSPCLNKNNHNQTCKKPKNCLCDASTFCHNPSDCGIGSGGGSGINCFN